MSARMSGSTRRRVSRMIATMLVEVYEALRLVAGCPEIDVLAWTMRLAAQAARIRGAGQAEQPAQQRPLA